MLKSDYLLADPFEVTGQWWLPGGEHNHVHGTLRYSHTNIELVLSGSLEPVSASNLMFVPQTFKQYPCILGLSDDQQRFTLLKTHVTSLGTTTKYTAIYIIEGAHTADLEHLAIHSLSFYCSGLDSFLMPRLFQQDEDGFKETFKGATI